MPVDLQVLCVAAAGKIYQYAVSPASRLVDLRDGEEEQTPPPKPDAADLKKVLLPEAEAEEIAANNGVPPLLGLNIFYHSVFPDVQERAQLVHYFATNCGADATIFCERELLAVAHGAQEAVVPADGLDLDTPFCDDIPALMSQTESDDDSEDEEEAARNAASEAAVRARDKKRREEVSAFYIKGEGGYGESENLPPVTTLEGLSSGNSPHQRSGNYREDGGRRAGKKTHTINREMAKPTTYAGPGAGPGGKRSHTPEVDEATRRLRDIDVTRALAADERLPEATTYAAMLSSKAREAADEARRAALAVRVPPVVAYSDKNCRVVIQVIDAKCKKSGYYIDASCVVSNLAPAASLYEVKLASKVTMAVIDPATGEDTGRTETIGFAEDAAEEKEKKKKGGDDEDDEKKTTAAASSSTGGDITCIERLKPSATLSKDFVLHLEELPSNFNSPATFTLSFTFEKKAHEVKLHLPFIFKFFAATAAEVPTAAVFNETILGTHLKSFAAISATIPLADASALAAAGSASAAKKAAASAEKLLLMALPTINATLRTHAIEVFKDSCTLYGQVISRKSHVNKSHIAVLLKQETEEVTIAAAAADGEEEGGAEATTITVTTGLTVAVKCASAAMGDSIIQEIGQIIFRETEEAEKEKKSSKGDKKEKKEKKSKK